MAKRVLKYLADKKETLSLTQQIRINFERKKPVANNGYNGNSSHAVATACSRNRNRSAKGKNQNCSQNLANQIILT